MNKYFLLSFLLITTLFISCASNPELPFIQELENVYLSIDIENLSRYELTYTIYNNDESTLSFGHFFSIYMYSNGAWNKIYDASVRPIALRILPHEDYTANIDFVQLKGSALSSGRYLLVIPNVIMLDGVNTSSYLITEFVISG